MNFKAKTEISYTDMCKFIDANLYNPEADKEKIWTYISQLIYMLSWKYKYFTSTYHYEKFAIFATSELFFWVESRKRRRNNIKSILNYLNAVLPFLKIRYQNNEFIQVNPNVTDFESEDYEVGLGLTVQYQADKLQITDFECYVQDIIKTIRNTINHIPKKKNSFEYYNIYLSCLLTLLDQFSFNEEQREKYKVLLKKPNKTNNYLDKIYLDKSKEEPKLFNLDDIKKDYIKILVNECKKSIMYDLNYLMDYPEKTLNSSKDIILSELYEGDQEEN